MDGWKYMNRFINICWVADIPMDGAPLLYNTLDTFDFNCFDGSQKPHIVFFCVNTWGLAHAGKPFQHHLS